MTARPMPLDSMVSSLSQPGLQMFVNAQGLVASHAGRLTLGAPVAEPSLQLAVARSFLEAHRAASFFYLTSPQAERLAPLGLRAVPVGEDFIIDLPSPTWPDPVLSAARKATKAGLGLRELDHSALVTHGSAMRDIQAAYLARHEVKHEMRFLTRPCEFETERLGRTFGLFVKEQLLGFAVVDPYTTEAGLPGALLNIFRIGSTKLWGVYFAVVKLLAEQLEHEGVRELSLGFLPLSFTPGADAAGLQLALLRRLAATSPYLRGLRHLKETFIARRETRWLLTPRRVLLRDFVTLIEAMGVYATPKGRA